MFNSRIYDKDTIDRWIQQQKESNLEKKNSNYTHWTHIDKLMDPITRHPYKFSQAIKTLYHTELEREHLSWILCNRFPKIDMDNVDDFLPEEFPISNDFILGKDLITIDKFVAKVKHMKETNSNTTGTGLTSVVTPSSQEQSSASLHSTTNESTTSHSTSSSSQIHEQSTTTSNSRTSSSITHPTPSVSDNPRPTNRP